MTYAQGKELAYNLRVEIERDWNHEVRCGGFEENLESLPKAR
jgi:hypothetical protein